MSINPFDQKRVLSIITPSYNQGEFLEETIQSVLSQKGDFFLDYIVTDGKSTDQSVEIIKKYNECIKENCKVIEQSDMKFYCPEKKNQFNNCLGVSYRWVSEKDKGQADAINKGFDMALGPVMGWINSDDLYFPNVFQRIVSLPWGKIDLSYGQGMWVSKDGKDLLPYPTFKPTYYNLYYQCVLCQPTVFMKKDVFKELGDLDIELYGSMDFEYWLRALKNSKRFYYLNKFVAKSRMYGENKSLDDQEKVQNDLKQVRDRYYAGLSLNRFRKYWSKKIANNRTKTAVSELLRMLES